MASSAIMLGAANMAFSGPGAASAPAAGVRSQISMSQELRSLAKDLNPSLGYWDPLNIAEWDIYGMGSEATIGWFRHAEIKHGRVAMAAFVGFCAQSNGIKFPWAPFDSIPGDISPAAQWDALPLAAQLQIIGFVGFLEIYSEHSFILEKEGQKHYMKGGKPGFFPSFDTFSKGVHPVPLDLYDPFKGGSQMSAEKKAERLLMEVNNGRLAMIGIMGFLAEARVPGSVPGLAGISLAPYDGEIMAPFSGSGFSLGFLSPF
jgi:hypothetical protein